MQPRQIFAKQQHPISAKIELFEIIAMAGAIGAGVPEPRRRHYKSAETGASRSQVEIDIFIIDEKAFVEAADALQHRAPDQQRGAEHNIESGRPIILAP